MKTTSLRLICATPLILAAAGCGSAKPEPVPDVSGQRLDVAQEALDDEGLGYEVIGGGALGVIVRSHWQVCRQDPRPGRRARSVEHIVARSCPQRFPRGLVPDLRGLRLDVADRELAQHGLEHYVYSEDQVMIRTNWTVCDQYPSAGGRASEVDLYVQHFSCDEDDDD